MSTPPLGLQRVLVTGGGTGIGLACCEAILAAGGQVVAVGRRAGPLEALAARFPGRAFALVADINHPTLRETLFTQAAERMGGLDGFVHSAGHVVHELPGHISDATLHAQLEVNLIAPLRLGEQALAFLPEGGAMVFIGSTLAIRPIATSAVYSAAKAGLMQVMRVLALAGAPRHIRANMVLPGVVDTEMVREVRLSPGEMPLDAASHAARVAQQCEALRALHPMGRLGYPADIAASVVHLLGAPWITGTAMVVDGGLMLRE